VAFRAIDSRTSGRSRSEILTHRTCCHTGTARYFGAMIAVYRKLKYDREVYFSAAILHDIGLTESRLTPLTQCCFAVSGGRQARDFLLGKDHPAAKAQIVGDAISAHLNLHLPVRKYGEVASLVAKGAVCDLFAFEKRKPRSSEVTCCAPIQPVTCRPPCSPTRRWLPVPGSILAESSQADCPSASGSMTSNRVSEVASPAVKALVSSKKEL